MDKESLANWINHFFNFFINSTLFVIPSLLGFFFGYGIGFLGSTGLGIAGLCLGLLIGWIIYSFFESIGRSSFRPPLVVFKEEEDQLEFDWNLLNPRNW